MIQNAVKTVSGEPMDRGEMLKMAAGMLVGFGVDMAVTALMGAHMPKGTGWRRVLRQLGIFALAMKLGEDAENYFNKVYTETMDAVYEMRKGMTDDNPSEGSTT